MGATMQRTSALTLITLFFFLLSCQFTHAAAKYLFKTASIAPKGSVWVDQFESFSKEISSKTGGEVSFRIYPGGVMGDDLAMYRKMRVGQLHGGGFTMTGISTVVPDFRVMAIPFLLESYEEIDHVKKGLLPTFKEQFREKGLELISLTEVGFIYAMSTDPIGTLKELKQSKNWIPTGDPISEAFLKKLDITPVQLSIPDVLSSLQSGLIDTVYNSLYGSIVLQWFTKANYIVNLPYGYAYGVFAVDHKKFAKLPPSHQQVIRDAAENHFPPLLKSTRESNKESRSVLSKHGSKFLDLDEESLRILQQKRDETINQLVPEAFSKEIYDHTIKLLQEYRNTVAGEKTN